MRRHGFLAITAAGCVAVCAWLLSHSGALDASEEATSSFRDAFSKHAPEPESQPDSGGVRLNYFDSSWEKVLSDVAEKTQLTLVMQKTPHGRFARRDRNHYSLESALQILNSELEPQGYRVLRQGQFLVVLKLDEARAKYARPILNDWKSTEAEQSAGQRPNPWEAVNSKRNDAQFLPASARNDGRTPQVAWAAQEREAETAQSPPAPFSDRVAPRTSSPSEQEPAETGPPVLRSVELTNRKASEVARSIYLVFETRAELIHQGLEGLPTCQVMPTPPAEGAANENSSPLFRIGIDQAQNRLLIEATKKRAEHLVRLVNEMDRAQENPESTIKLLPNKGVSEVTAKDLTQQIHRMVAMSSPAAQPPVNGSSSGSSQGNTDSDASLNLRGDVNVQAMQDLGILILKGNDADVQKVEAIIKQLEEMSVGSLPDVHLRTLKYVNSEAMAELLTTVYDQLAELRNRDNDRKTAAFIPVVQPNAILIITPRIDLDAILLLADELDQQTDPSSEFRAFSLRNAIASQVADALTSFYEERGGLGTRIRVIPDVRTNSIIAQGRPNDLEEISKLIEKFDKDEPGAVHRVEIIELHHATATELATTINSAIQSVSSPPQQVNNGAGGFGGNQGAQELRDGKSAALEFLATTSGGRELIRSGILVDVRVNADVRSNTLIISAPEASMALLKALVQQLDRAPLAVAEIKVFALKNADAEQSVELLTSMFENQNQEDQLGVQIAGAEDASSSLIPVQFSADLRTNTVIAVGSAESLAVVEAILLRLDTTQSRQRTTNVIALRNVQASVVSAALESFLQQQQQLQDSSTDLISNIERLRQEVIISPDNNSNSLIVSASPEYFSEISQIIQQLDANPPQVIIQALLVEVQLDNTDEFGVELGFQDPLLFSRSILNTAADIVSTTNITQAANGQQIQQTVIQSRQPTPGFNFNNTSFPLGNNAANNTGAVGSQGLSNFSLGRQNGDLGFGGFVFSAQSDAVSVLVRALAARRTVHVLSRPQIRTTHNNLASIEVGQDIPVVNGVAITNNIVAPQTERRNVGIVLRVTPRVTPDGDISMSVYAEKSALSPGGVPVFTDAASGNVVESVVIDAAIADTTVTVPNGQTIVIGGMITKSDETLERKVPWLGDLPLVGNLFRYDGTNTARTELLIFLTPRIIYSDADSELIKQVESERMHFLESEAEKLHGPLYSVPPSGLDQSHNLPASEHHMMLPDMISPVPDPNLPQQSDFMLPPQVENRDGNRKPSDAVQQTSRDVPSGEKSGVRTAGNSVKNPAASEDWDLPPTTASAATAASPESEEAEKAAAANWVRRVLQKSKMKGDRDDADHVTPVKAEARSVSEMRSVSAASATGTAGRRQGDSGTTDEDSWVQKMSKANP
ncbi:MAG: secretin N-terminal domain-containing protein [Planctomycetaceae bacterium]